MGQREDNRHIHNRISNVRSDPGHGTSTASKTTDVLRVSPHEDHTTRKVNKGDQPNDGTITWTNWRNITHSTGRGRAQRARSRLYKSGTVC